MIELNSAHFLRPVEKSKWPVILLLFEFNRATLDVDLRALGVLSQQGSLILSPGSLLDLDVSLTTPLWSNVVENDVAEQAITRKDGDRLIWTCCGSIISALAMR